MPTLDEAVAKLDRQLGFAWDKNTAGGADAIAEIKATVRDVALASAREAWNCNCDSAFAELNAEIDRLFGDK